MKNKATEYISVDLRQTPLSKHIMLQSKAR